MSDIPDIRNIPTIPTIPNIITHDNNINITLNNDSKILNLLEEWRIYCDIHAKMHSGASSFFKKLNYLVMITSILMSSVASILSIGLISQKQECGVSNDQKESILIILNGITIGSSGLMTIHKLLKLDEMHTLHSIYSDTHTCLAKDIQMHNILSTSDTPVFKSLNEMAKNVKSRLDILIDKSPAVPDFISKRVINFSVAMYSNKLENLDGIHIRSFV